LSVRFYVDADTLGLARILCRIRSDVTYPGDPGDPAARPPRPPCPITDPETPDPVWIPVVAAAGWLILTRDQHIRTRPAEIKAVVDSGARLVAIVASSPNERLNNFGILEIVMINWRRIDGIESLPGPYVYTASRSGLTKVA